MERLLKKTKLQKSDFIKVAQSFDPHFNQTLFNEDQRANHEAPIFDSASAVIPC